MTAIIYIDGGGPVEVEFVELTTNGSGTNISIAANFGATASGRRTIVAVHCTNAGTPNLLSAIIGGIAATILISETGESGLGIYWLLAENVPGTSGNIDLTFSGTSGARCGIWRATNVEDSAAIGTDTEAWSFDPAARSLSLDVEERGAMFAAVTTQANAPDFTAGVTVEAYSVEFVPTSPIKIAAGFALTPATALSQTVTADRGGGSTWRGNLAGFSIR